jgi:hypothetical protein
MNTTNRLCELVSHAIDYAIFTQYGYDKRMLSYLYYATFSYFLHIDFVYPCQKEKIANFEVSDV